MKLIFSKFLKGLLYLFTLPGLIVILSVGAVVGIFYFFALGVKGIILFFQGKSLFKDLPEDIEVRRIKASNQPVVEEEKKEEDPMIVFTANSLYNFEPLQRKEETTEERKIEDDTTPNSDSKGGEL